MTSSLHITAESVGERILKVGQHFGEVMGQSTVSFLTHGVERFVTFCQFNQSINRTQLVQ